MRHLAFSIGEGSPIRIKRKKVTQVVELDQMKAKLLTYETPLAEVRDSL